MEQKIEDIIDKVDKIAVIDQGQVIAYGAPRDVLKSKELYNVMPYPCVSRLAIELKAPEMLLSMEEGQKYLATAGITMKPGSGNGPGTDVKGSPLLEVKDLRFAYGGIKVLHDISFKVMPGDVIAVLGHNGCGKTTLLKNVIGLLKPPEKGMVLLGGKDVVDMAVDQAAKMAGFLFQNPDNMLFADTALEEVMFGPTNLGFADAKERSLRAMEEVGLAHKTAEYPRYLGNGEKLRLCVASILAMGPRLIILDEPTTGLDDNECARLMEVVLKLKSEGVAMLIVTHDMNLVAKYADRAIVISNGKNIPRRDARRSPEGRGGHGGGVAKVPVDRSALVRLWQSVPDSRRVHGGAVMSGAEVFQYIDGDTPVHKLNPMVKILFSVFVIVAGIINADPLVLILLMGIPIVALMTAGMTKDVINQGKMLLVVFGILILITVLTVRSGEMYSLGGIGLATYDGFLAGVLISLRLGAMFFSFLLLVTTTRPGDLVNTLVSRMHFPMDYALMIMITMRFIPTLQVEARKISEAQAVRGFKPAGLSDMSRIIGPTITPLLSNSIGRAGSLGHVIELRGYRSSSKIKFTEIPLKKKDYACIAGIIVLMAGFGLYALGYI